MRKNIFEKYKLIYFICSLLCRFGVYIKIHWSGNRFKPSAKTLGLEISNNFKNFKYRMKFIYLTKQQREKLTSLDLYNNICTFILNPR